MASTVVFCGYPGARLASVYCRWRACFCLASVDGMDGRVPGVVEAVGGSGGSSVVCCVRNGFDCVCEKRQRSRRNNVGEQ